MTMVNPRGAAGERGAAKVRQAAAPATTGSGPAGRAEVPKRPAGFPTVPDAFTTAMLFWNPVALYHFARPPRRGPARRGTGPARLEENP